MARIKMPASKVETLKHQDKRANIPTEELRDFVAEDEKKPKMMLYSRDPSLDPQLVWKGKAEDATRQPEQIRAFRDTWKLGIHSYLAYLRDRLTVARELLTESGSGTTAYVAEQWGRRWITIDTSRDALALARTRLMAAKFPYYLLADSPEGTRKEAELSGKLPSADFADAHRLKEEGNANLRKSASSADSEDTKRIRVTGPFTVESLSPHRVLSAVEDLPAAEREAQEDWGGNLFMVFGEPDIEVKRVPSSVTLNPSSVILSLPAPACGRQGRQAKRRISG